MWAAYKDAEAILHECTQLQAHLKSQNDELAHIVQHMEVVAKVQAGADRFERRVVTTSSSLEGFSTLHRRLVRLND